MVLNPEAFTVLINCWVVVGLPQAVSLQMASRVLPRFQPTFIWLAIVCAVGNWVLALMDNKSATNKFAIASFRFDTSIVRSFFILMCFGSMKNSNGNAVKLIRCCP